MSEVKPEIPFSLMRKLMQEPPKRGPKKLPKPGVLTNPHKGYKYRGYMIIENFQVKENTVPERLLMMNESNGEIIIEIESETIVEEGKLVKDKITAKYYEREFLCC